MIRRIKLRWPRKFLNRRLRLISLIILGLFLCGLAYNLYATYKQPVKVVRSVPVVKYKHEGALNYKVHLKPNTIYGTQVLGPGQTYFTKLVDRVEVEASYRFSASKPAQLNGTYNVTADLIAEDMPSKHFVLVPEVKKRIPLLTYEQGAALDYKVIVEPSDLYESTTLEPGQTYFAKLVDYIEATASYQFSGDKPAELHGIYRVVGLLQSEGLWEKEVVILPAKEFNSKDKGANFSQTFSIDLNHFRELVKGIDLQTGVTSRNPKLVVRLVVETQAKVKDGQARETLAPFMIIPLGRSSFKIDGELSQQKVGTIEKIETGPGKLEFGSQEKTFALGKKFSIDPTKFSDLLDNVAKETGVVPREPRLVIKLNVEAKVKAPEGEAAESLTPSLVIPLGESTFKIAGELSQQKAGTIERKETITRKWVLGKRRNNLIPVVIVFLAFLGLLTATRSKPGGPSPTEREVSRARRKHGDRIAEARQALPPKSERVIPLSSMKDLVKVADELGKPVIHQPPASPGEPHLYYVLDGTIRYEYLLGEEGQEED